MAIEGPLRELGIHDVFQLLDLSRKTGVLRVVSDLRHNEGRVWFEGGAVVGAELKSNPHPLGEVLVRAGKITEADLHRARDMQQSGDQRPIGGVLMEIGAITEKELDRQVMFQTEEVIFEMMSWQEGHFSFEDGHTTPVPADGSTHIRTEALLMEGARRIDEWSRMKSKIPHVGVVPTLSAAGDTEEGELDLLPDEWEVLAAIDGEKDIRGIASALVRSEFEVARTLFGLASAGMLTMVTPPQKPPEKAPAEAAVDDLKSVLDEYQIAMGLRDYERARAAAEAGIARHPHSGELHLCLARVLNAERDPKAAEEYCRRALRLDSMLSDAHRLLGNVLAEQGRFTDAIEWWERWLRMQDQSGQAPPEAGEVRQAVRAAQTLHNLLSGAR